MTQVIRNLHGVYSLYGRNVNDTHSFDILYRTLNGTTNDDIRNLHEDVVGLVKGIFPSQVQFLRATSSLARGPRMPHIRRGQQVSQRFAIPGTRANTANKELADLNYVAVFEKTADGGTAGQLRFRGTFMDDEVETVEGQPELADGLIAAPYQAIANGLIDLFTANACEMVIPAAAGDNFVTGARKVKELAFLGVGQLTPVVHRRSLSQNKKAYATGVLRSIADRIYNLTHNPDGSINVLSAALIAAFVLEAGPVILDVGITYAAGLPVWAELPEAVQAGLLAFKAAGA